MTARLKHDVLSCSRESFRIFVAMFTVSRRSVNIVIYWVAMYNEAKLAFFIYSTETDRTLVEWRARFDVTFLHVQKDTSHGQMRAVEIMQYVAKHCKGKPKPSQERNGAVSKQSPIIAQNLQSFPTLKDKLNQHHLETSSKNKDGNVPAQMASPIAKLPDPTLGEGILENLKESPLSTNGLASGMTVFPKFTIEITNPFKKNGV
ncbi:HVA22-like protein i [Papaver somniferum]|uniref:HVA22-like protein i n=1 Tax=Papaver somniferum TaxID=3469 RepID=UPI000E6FE997|nr:HVA22-like protein i [Papaver somniferum]